MSTVYCSFSTLLPTLLRSSSESFITVNLFKFRQVKYSIFPVIFSKTLHQHLSAMLHKKRIFADSPNTDLHKESISVQFEDIMNGAKYLKIDPHSCVPFSSATV